MSAKTILITGASGGIGAATAARLTRAGHTVYASARNIQTLEPLRALRCRPLTLDVTDEASMVEAIQTIAREQGAVDVLINNAGYGLNGPVELLDIDAVRREFETNVFSLVRLSQLVLPGMRERRWGRVINVGSVGGSFTAPGAGAYHASKYAVEAFSDALRMETRSFGIDVVLVKPTGVHTLFANTLEHSAPLPPEGSVYRAFTEHSLQVTRDMFGKNARRSGIIKPDVVAKAIHAAIAARRPHPRYVVGFSGHVYLALRRTLPDRAWDAVMALQFPMQPRPKRHADRSAANS